jgi:hypothetical protein
MSAEPMDYVDQTPDLDMKRFYEAKAKKPVGEAEMLCAPPPPGHAWSPCLAPPPPGGLWAADEPGDDEE